MPNMDDIMQRHPNYDDTTEDSPVRVTPGENSDPQAAIRRMTGINMTQEQINERMKQVPKEALKSDAPVRKIDPTYHVEPEMRTGVMGVLTPDEAAQFTATPQKIDVEEEADRQRNARADEIISSKNDETANLLQAALSSEEDRLERHENALEDDDERKKIFTPPTVDGDESSRRVRYEGPDTTDDLSAQKKAAKEAPRTSISDEDASVDAGLDDLVPAYDFSDENEEAPKADDEEAKTNRPSPDEDDKKYAEYVKSLDIVPYDEPDDSSIIKIAKEKVEVQTVSSGREKNKIMGDQAFLNSITKFKKDNFRTVTVPLVNSGFMVDIVGTGSVDLTLLYTTIDKNISAVDYELDKMRTVMRNVVGTHPKIDKNNLRNMIHFSDYNMMAYAHIVATLKEVEMITTCEECGSDFHVVCDSKDLLLNMDELREKMNLIKSADSIAENSLMSTNRVVTTDSGFVINLGHPSYAEYIQYLSELRNLAQNIPGLQAARIAQMVTILPWIRSINLPTHIHTNSLLQRYMALGLLNEVDFKEVQNEVKKMRDKIIRPKFGIKKVTCPHCHHVNTNIDYDSLDDLLFFHTTVTRWMNNTEE